MSDFTSAVPCSGSPDAASAKVHPLPERTGKEPDEVSMVTPFQQHVEPEKASAAVKGVGGTAEYTVEKRATFDPDSEFFRNWDIFTTILLVFTAVVTPFEARGVSGELNRREGGETRSFVRDQTSSRPCV